MDRPMAREPMPAQDLGPRQTRRQFLGTAAGVALVAGTAGYSSPARAAGETLGVLWCMPSPPTHLKNWLKASLEVAGLGSITRRDDYGVWADPNSRLEAARRLAGLSGGDPVEVILTMDSLSTEAARDVTRGMTSPLPVVVAMCGDPRQLTKNMTGLTNTSRGIAQRRLIKLRQLLDGNGRSTQGTIAVLMNPQSESSYWQWTEVQNFPWISLTSPVTATSPDDVSNALAGLDPSIRGLLVLSDPVMAHARDYIRQFAASSGIPTMHSVKETVVPPVSGPPPLNRGLMSYAVDRDFLVYQVGSYVAQVLALSTAQRSDLSSIPVRRGDYEFYVNTATRFAQGLLNIPPGWYVVTGSDALPTPV